MAVNKISGEPRSWWQSWGLGRKVDDGAAVGCTGEADYISTDEPLCEMCEDGCVLEPPLTEDTYTHPPQDTHTSPPVDVVTIDIPPEEIIPEIVEEAPQCELQSSIKLEPGKQPIIADEKQNTRVQAFSEPIIEDLNHDGSQEIIFTSSPLEVGYPPQLFVYNYAGELVWKEPLEIMGEETTPVGVKSSCAAADIDGDLNKEIVCSGATKDQMFIMAFNYDGTPVEGWPVYVDEESSMPAEGAGESALTISIGDVKKEASGKILLEVAAKTQDNVYLFSNNGQLISPWPIAISGTKKNIALGDVDKDGQMEICGFATSSQIACWKADAAQIKSYSLASPAGWGSSISLADLDKDGDLEIIVRQPKTVDTSPKISVFNSYGPQDSVSPSYDNGLISTGSIGQLGGKDKDIYILDKGYVVEEDPFDPEIKIKWTDIYGYKFAWDGLELDFQAAIEPIGAQEEKEGAVLSDYAAIADVDGDKSQEILVTTQKTDTTVLRIFNSAGEQEAIFEKKAGNPCSWNSPAVADLDGKGGIDVVVTGYEENIGGWLYIYNCNGKYEPSLVNWPMHRHDPAGTVNHEGGK